MTATDKHRLRLLSVNIQAGSSTRRYSDYVTRSWSHALPSGNKRVSLDSIAKMAGEHDIVGLQEADPGSLRSGFTNQTHYLAEQGGFDYWSHQTNRNVGRVASSANGLLSKLEPMEVSDHALPGRIGGRGVLLARFGDGDEGLVVAVAHLSLGANSRRARRWKDSRGHRRRDETVSSGTSANSVGAGEGRHPGDRYHRQHGRTHHEERKSRRSCRRRGSHRRQRRYGE